MSYLEELLPEFRNGAKIRLNTWPENQYIYKKGKEIYNEDGEISKFLDNYVMTCDLWEFYKEPEPDWDYIIKNRCLCWFWDDGKEERRTMRYLSRVADNYSDPFISYLPIYGYLSFQCCRPVRRDEITFYEDKKDD